MFLHVSVSPQGGAGCPIACWDIPPPGQTPLGQTPPRQAASGQTPLRPDTPWPDTPMLEYGQQAGGTHPTGMQSCF